MSQTRKRKMPTSVDVATAAGVSQTAVSVALSGRSGSTRLSAATRKRILDAADDLNYVPHKNAVALRRQQSMVVLFMTRPSRVEPFGQVIPHVLTTAARGALAEHGYSVLVAQPEELTDGGDSLPALIQRLQVDGVLYDSPDSPGVMQALDDAGVPSVMLIRPVETAGRSSSVVVDPQPGMTAAIDHLEALGHRRIAYIGREKTNPIDQHRLECFQEALARYSGHPKEASTFLVPDYSIQAGHRGAERALASSEPATAIITSSDGLTLGALRYAYENHIRIPGDLSLISFDDAMVADLYPPITSISQPFAECAATAVDLLIEAISDEHPLHQQLALATRFHVRSSTAAPNSSNQDPEGNP